VNITPQRVRVGARSSPLSIAQTEEVLGILRPLFPLIEFVFVPVSVLGDEQKAAPLLSMARGMFVKGIEAALLSGTIDMAVHSAKDMPAELPEGLAIAAYTERQDPRDVLVSKSGAALADLPPNSVIGTSSPRRSALVRSLRDDLIVRPIRGNVGTRLEKALTEDYDAVVLAAAGLIRLGLIGRISEYFSPEIFVPDTGQGALALQVRAGDMAIMEIAAAADHAETSAAVKAERAFLTTIGGGCKVPVASFARVQGDVLQIGAVAATTNGRHVYRSVDRGPISEPELLGRRAATALLDAGASAIVGGGATP
jgi:hydroxymethylbilane synthase